MDLKNVRVKNIPTSEICVNFCYSETNAELMSNSQKYGQGIPKVPNYTTDIVQIFLTFLMRTSF